MWLLHKQGFTVRFLSHNVLLDGGNFQQKWALFLPWNLLSYLKGKTPFCGAGLEFAGEQGQGSGQWVWTRNTDSLFSPLTGFCSRLFCSLVRCCNIQVEKCQGRRCLWRTLSFIDLLLLHKKRCLRLMFLNRKQIFCFKTELRVF